jgi:carbamoyl-phosphate synthase large subunit
MKRILVTGAGGSPAANFTRSLRMAPEKFYLIGVDCDKYYLQRAETDEKYLVPAAREDDYVAVMNKIIDKTKAEFLHVQNDAELYYVSKYRDKLNIKTFLPRHETVEKCQNKLESYKCWSDAGLRQPLTFNINSVSDLKEAFSKIRGEVWIREISGAGGKGSLKTDSFDVAKTWIDFRKGWGVFTAAECLKEQSTTWLSIWKDGELIVAQERKRLYWELSKLAPSGISGATGTGVTVADPLVNEIAQKAILAIDQKPHGIFGVDLTYSGDAIPNPTEINIGRFFTTHHFFAVAGLNIAYIFVKIAFGEKIPPIPKKINPIKPGFAWIRGIDFLPVFTTVEKIERYEEELKNLRMEIKNNG